MPNDVYHLFRVVFSSVALLLRIVNTLAPLWSSVFTRYSRSALGAFLRRFSGMVHILRE